jgi:hypothetical protein
MFEMLSFNYLYAIMLISVVGIIYYYWTWMNGGKDGDGRMDGAVLLLPVLIMAVIIVPMLERELFYKLTGRGEELKKMNALPPQRASPLVVPAKRYGLSVPLPGGIRLDF